MKRIALLFATVFLTAGLIGCSGSAVDAAPAADPEDYIDMPAGEIWVVLEDGTVDKFENHTDGWAYGIEYFLDAIEDDEAYYTERYEGATYVVHCQVKSTKNDWQTRSGDTFETAIELTCDEGYLQANA